VAAPPGESAFFRRAATAIALATTSPAIALTAGETGNPELRRSPVAGFQYVSPAGSSRRF
jgi:hypothetical protein